MFGDLIPAKGSLGGIYTALRTSPTVWTVCVACDMPFLDPALLAYLIEQHGLCDAVVPVVNARPQALHTVYHRRCTGPIHDALMRDDLKIQHLFRRISVHFIDEARIQNFDLRSFMNVNTPDELALARTLVTSDCA